MNVINCEEQDLQHRQIVNRKPKLLTIIIIIVIA